MSGLRPHGRRDSDLRQEEPGECGHHSLVSDLSVSVCEFSDTCENISFRDSQADVIFHQSELYVNYDKLPHCKPSSLCSLPVGGISDQPYRENYTSLQVHPKTSENSQPVRCFSNSHYQQRHPACERKVTSPSGLQNSDQCGRHRVCQGCDPGDWKRQEKELVAIGDVENPPARLPAISGILTEKLGRPLIRPIAFRPIHGNAACVVSPSLSIGSVADSVENLPNSDGCSQQVWGSVSGAWPRHSHSHDPVATLNLKRSTEVRTSGLSNDYSHHEALVDVGMGTSAVTVVLGPSRRQSGSLLGSGLHHQQEAALQTPSPSDSGVGELEAMLKEKDAEIQILRQVMDNNERAILQVYEEKRNGWLHDVHEIREEYEEKLRAQQSKGHKTEQSLRLQVARLQQDKQQMEGELDALRSDREALLRRCAVFQHQVHDLRLQMEAATTLAASTVPCSGHGATSPLICLPEGHAAKASGACSEWDASLEVECVDRKLAHIKSKENSSITLQGLPSELQFKPKVGKADSTELKNILILESSSQIQKMVSQGRTGADKFTQTDQLGVQGSSSREDVARQLAELEDLQQHVQVAEQTLEMERRRWMEEKNKVIRYQKQLQLNYVQTQRKNTALEAEVQQLTLELERRDLKLIAMNGEESVC